MRKKSDSYRHGNLREALIEDALKLLREKSVEELSVRELAERAGVSPRAPYVHFPQKKDLLRAVANRGFAELASVGAHANGDIIALGEAYVRLALGHPNLFHLMFSNMLGGDCPDARASFEQVSAAIEAQRPSWDREQVANASLAAWAFVHGLSELRLLGLISDETWEGRSIGSLAQAFAQVISATS